jgi:hypothetical protein
MVEFLSDKKVLDCVARDMDREREGERVMQERRHG